MTAQKVKTLAQTKLKGRLPNLIIIGAMKCGTSSLHQYLDLHPQISMSATKELDFFIKEKNWSRGLAWYRQQFSDDFGIAGESSPNYTKYPAFSGVPERMHRHLPEAKLIYIVRDPIKRIMSHYAHQYTNRDEFQDLNKALANPQYNHYVYTSCYGSQLTRFLEFYDKKQILVVSLEALANDRLAVLRSIFQFLGVDANFEHPNFSYVFHQSSQKRRLTGFGKALFSLPAGGRLARLFPGLTAQDVKIPTLVSALDSHVLTQLKETLMEDVNHLRDLTGQSFMEWSL